MSGICQTCGKETTSALVAAQCPNCLLGAGLIEDDVTAIDPASGTNALGRVGDYELLEEINRGGMGVVYRAQQISLHREVAIKMILTGRLASPDAVERFLTEARAVARLDHPNIISVYEVNELKGDYFFSMQLIKGGSLAERLDAMGLHAAGSSKASADQCQHAIAKLIAKLAHALSYAHGRGVLHRDIKPGNVLIDEQGEPVLTDFGLAKLTDLEGDDLTKSLAVLGSPVYMAPEQAQGGARDVTIAADVYGLGAILYELLSGKRLFEGKSTMATLQQVINDEPTPIVDRQPRVNADLATICHKCLEKEPRRRYTSAFELEEDLGRYLRGEPVMARPVSPLGRASRWAGRNPWLAALSISIAMVSLIGAAGILWQWTRAKQANRDLTQSVERLEWRQVNILLEGDQSQRAVARLAQWIRRDPNHWRAATYAMSILEQNVFPLPVGLPLPDPGQVRNVTPQLSADGKFVAIAHAEAGVSLFDTHSGISRLICPDTWIDSLAFHPTEPLLIAGTHLRMFAYATSADAPRIWEVPVSGRPHEILVSRNGARLVARLPQAIQVWECGEGNAPPSALAMIECASEIRGLRVDQTGTRLLTWTSQSDEPLSLWTLTEEGSLHERKFPASQVRLADLSADGSRVAASTGLHRFRVWPAEDPNSWIESNEIRGTIDSLALSPDGSVVYVAGRHGLAHTWDTTTGALLRSELTHQYEIPSMEIGEQSQRILTASTDHTARIWDLKTGVPICGRMMHQDDVLKATMNRDGSRILTLAGERDRSAQVWRIPIKPAPRIYSPPDARDMYAVVLSPSQQLVAVGSERDGGHIITVTRLGGDVVFGPEFINDGVYGALFTPDESQFLVVTAAGSIYSWAMDNWEPSWPPIHYNAVTISAIMSPDGSFIATGSADGKLRIWRLPDGKLLRTLTHGGDIMGLDFSLQGDRIASASRDGTAKVWNALSGDEICHFTKHDRPVLCVHFDREAKRVLSASYDSTARVWDAQTGRELTPPLRHRGELANARFSPDGKIVASGSRDGVMRVWDAATGTPLTNPILHRAPVRTIRFSPNGKRLLSVDHDGARVWDVATWEPLTVHFEHPIASGLGVDTPCMRESFTPDGNQIYMGVSSDQARFWNIPNAPPEIPLWFPEFLEVIAGLRFDKFDQIQLVSPQESLALRQEIETKSGHEPYLVWAQNYLAQ